MSEIWTPRLHLRPFRLDDFEAHARICADDDVMKYIRAGALSREDSWWQLARYMGHWQPRGYGLWAVVERSTEKLVGHLGFLDPEGSHGLELGWALARDVWGKGYALEGVRAALQYGFETLGFKRVLCVIRPENARSIHLAERLGATLTGETPDTGGRPGLLVYALSSPTSLRIRDVRKNELEALGQLMVDVYSRLDGFPTRDEQPAYFEMLANIGRFAERKDVRVLVAISAEGELLGGVVYIGDMAQYGSGGVATTVENASGIRLLGVSSSSRGLGVGKALTRACIQFAREKRHAQVVLHTTQAMKIAWSLYERLGFQRSEDLDFMQGELPVYGFRLSLAAG